MNGSIVNGRRLKMNEKDTSMDGMKNDPFLKLKSISMELNSFQESCANHFRSKFFFRSISSSIDERKSSFRS